MVDEGVLDGFEYHAPNSVEDQEGKDFTVWIKKGHDTVRQSFGITISLQCCDKRHYPIPEFCFPVETTDKTIKRRVLSLFNDALFTPSA